MEIAVNHLTRMSTGRICVAGIDLKTGRHVRPVLENGLPTSLLERNGGPFDVGNVVELGQTAPCPQTPKVEDHWFSEANAQKLRLANADGYWGMLNAVSKDDLAHIFGNQLVITDTHKAYLPQHCGAASLGCLIPIEPPEIFMDWGKARARVKTKFMGNAISLDLSPTDIRLYGANHSTPDLELIEDLNRRMVHEKVVLGVGVGYAAQFGHYPWAHWLQVNAIHLSGSPTWQLH